jgi:hypothetical protein
MGSSTVQVVWHMLYLMLPRTLQAGVTLTLEVKKQRSNYDLLYGSWPLLS